MGKHKQWSNWQHSQSAFTKCDAFHHLQLLFQIKLTVTPTDTETNRTWADDYRWRGARQYDRQLINYIQPHELTNCVNQVPSISVGACAWFRRNSRYLFSAIQFNKLLLKSTSALEPPSASKWYAKSVMFYSDQVVMHIETRMLYE